MVILKNQAEYTCWKRRKGSAVPLWFNIERNGYRALFDGRSETDLKMATQVSSRLRNHPYVIFKPTRHVSLKMVMGDNDEILCNKCGFPVSIIVRGYRRASYIEQTDVCPICNTPNMRFISAKAEED